jgi:hypothetical protein
LLGFTTLLGTQLTKHLAEEIRVKKNKKKKRVMLILIFTTLVSFAKGLSRMEFYNVIQ